MVESGGHVADTHARHNVICRSIRRSLLNAHSQLEDRRNVLFTAWKSP